MLLPKIHRVSLVFCLLAVVSTTNVPSPARTSRFIRLPFLGYICSGCPPHYCDDDPAIIFGYCCGCARFWDVLPVRCSNAIGCPPNGYELCERTGIKRIVNGNLEQSGREGEGKLQVKYQAPFAGETNLIVLDTDYDNYSVVWSCSGFGPLHAENAWILTRERLPSGSILQKAYGVLDRYRISHTFFIKTDQEGCALAASDINAAQGISPVSTVAEQLGEEQKSSKRKKPTSSSVVKNTAPEKTKDEEEEEKDEEEEGAPEKVENYIIKKKETTRP